MLASLSAPASYPSQSRSQTLDSWGAWAEATNIGPAGQEEAMHPIMDSLLGASEPAFAKAVRDLCRVLRGATDPFSHAAEKKLMERVNRIMKGSLFLAVMSYLDAVHPYLSNYLSSTMLAPILLLDAVRRS